MKSRKVHALHKRGFALIITMMLMALLVVTAISLLSLATITVRSTNAGLDQSVARANARMALMQAIGQLQLNLGPDRRVSASADIMGDDVSQPYWTGVWRSRPKNDADWLTRDDLNGGLRDTRTTDKNNLAANNIAWLVSGEGVTPQSPLSGAVTELVGKDRSGNKPVQVPTMDVHQNGDLTGHIAWWTGDLGIRANVQVPDAHVDSPVSPSSPTANGYARVMASQRVDELSMTGKKEIPADTRQRLATEPTVSLGAGDSSWALQHFLDYTTYSSGVLADVNHGGLKQDLTVYFAGNGDIASKDGLPGLSDQDLLVGEEPLGQSGARTSTAVPRFGLLRKWAKSAAPFSGENVQAIPPETVAADKSLSESLALCNENAAKVEGDRQPSLQPIMTEATLYTQLSTYRYAPGLYQLRTLLYPRVVLWNPYNVKMKVPASVAMIQGNGRQETWIASGNLMSILISFEGGRSTAFPKDGSDIAALFDSPGYNDPYMGSYYFSIPETTFKPGECLVFSPDKAAEYNGLSAYNTSSYDLSKNTLSCSVNPDPSRCYYVSATNIGDALDYAPTVFWYAPTGTFNPLYDIKNQGEDSRAILKALPSGSGPITYEKFDTLPQLCILSGSLQYGAGREPRLAWNPSERMKLELLTATSPRPTVVPNVRTREGIRMRWFNETPSNLSNSGALTNTAYFEDAILANWNPRASYILRSPWENVGGSLPVTGTGGGPWFFGAFTRDMPDQDVDWASQAPVPSGGTFHGNPFGPPQEGKSKIVLFDVPRTETGVISLGQLQHAKLSEFIWDPSYAIGNSLANPRVGGAGNTNLDHTAAIPDSIEVSQSGFAKNSIGWSNDKQVSATTDSWAASGRAILLQSPLSDNLVYDLSYEANRTLWDRFYFSSGDVTAKSKFLEDPTKNALPNGRMRIAPDAAPTIAQLNDFNRAAANLMVDGSFNVNSTRVEAWKAVLASTRKAGFGSDQGVPFPRILNPPGSGWTSAQSADDDSAWSGYRSLTDDEITRLAEAIVEQVKLRGPFLSMADFVNRRLANDETGRMGALQAAIENAGLNEAFNSSYPLDNTKSLPDYRHPDNIEDSTRFEQTLKPSSKGWGLPAYLTQADVLQVLAPTLSARSDTFVVRAYGDSTAANGEVRARAWCEAVVQRLPEPLNPDKTGINPMNPDSANDFGRRFALVSFRWLNQDEL